MSFSKSSSFHHKIAILGLFAALLLTFGPVFSQVQAFVLLNNPVTSQMAHHETMTHQMTENFAVAETSTDKSSTAKETKSHHDMSLCGYCDLVHHSPLITIYSPLIIQDAPLQQSVYPLYLVDYRSPSYCRGLSRAPPFELTKAITS